MVKELIDARLTDVANSLSPCRKIKLTDCGRCPRMRVAAALGVQGRAPSIDDARYVERSMLVQS